MNQFKIPSLFCIIFLFFGMGFIPTQNLYSQIDTDSSDYYGKVFLDPNSTDNRTAAFHYFENGIKKDLEKKDILNAVRKLRFLTIGQREMGAYYDSEKSAAQALMLIETLPEDSLVLENKRGIYFDLGIAYRKLNNPENSLRYYEQALKLPINIKDSLMTLSNIGNVYADMGDDILAAEKFKYVYENFERLKDTFNMARAQDNWGFIQSKTNPVEGLENMLAALRIRIKNEDLPGMYSSYRHLATHYEYHSEKGKAMEYANKALAIALQLKSPSYLENALLNILKIRDDTIISQYIHLNDSIAESQLQKQNKYAAMQYDVSKEQKKTEDFRYLQEKEKRRTQQFQFLGILLLIALIAIYFIQRSQNRKNTIKQILNTEVRLSKKVHDEVANDVYHLMTKMQISDVESHSLLDDLENIYTKTRDISRETSDIGLKEDFGKQIMELLQTYQLDGTVITIQNLSQIKWKDFSEEKKTTIYRILQELMTNMKKHSKASQVLVSFQKMSNKLQIKYADNGIGSNLKNKNGLANVETRIKAIKGSINFETSPQKGFKITLTI